VFVQLIDGGLVKVSSMAFDWITKNIYWTDLNLDRIEVASADGRFRAPLITENITRPHCIVLDPRQGYVTTCESCNLSNYGKRKVSPLWFSVGHWGYHSKPVIAVNWATIRKTRPLSHLQFCHTVKLHDRFTRQSCMKSRRCDIILITAIIHKACQ